MQVNPADVEAQLDQLLDALSNRHRREIVYLLALQPFAINRLAEIRGLSLPAIHKHLRILETAGLINRRKSGRTNFLTLNPGPLALMNEWLGHFHVHWSGPAATYDNYLPYLRSTGHAAEESHPPEGGESR